MFIYALTKKVIQKNVIIISKDVQKIVKPYAKDVHKMLNLLLNRVNIQKENSITERGQLAVSVKL